MKSTFYIIILLTLSIVTHSQDKKISVGFLSERDYRGADLETKAAYDFLKGYYQEIKPEYLTFFNVSNDLSVLYNFDVIWIHRPDTFDLSAKEMNPNLLESMGEFVKSGGGLLLTLDGMKFLKALDYEPVPLQVKWKKAEDQGYGRKLGLHSFRHHPLFEKLHGGAYIYKPVMDIDVRLLGYFDSIVPQNGKVVAVDWDYIFLREDQKLVMEYESGNGKVLGIGAYTYFAAPNYHHRQMKLFMINAINYLSENDIDEEIYYWSYESPEISSFDSKLDTVSYKPSYPWLEDTLSPSLYRQFGSSAYWDVASPQMLIMGKEQGGIDEIWAHPFLALRDYSVGIKFSYEDSVYWLNSERPEITVKPGSFERVYKFERAYLTEIITTDMNNPTCIVHYEYRGVYPARLFIKFSGNFRFMWPYSEEVMGNMEYTYSDSLNAFVCKTGPDEFVMIAGSNSKIRDPLIGNYNDFIFSKDGNYAGKETDKYLISAISTFDLEMNDNFDFIISASMKGIENTIDIYNDAAGDPYQIFRETADYYNCLINNSLMINSPDRTFNEGYLWSVIATDQFFVNTEGLGSSLVAGYATSNKGWCGGHEVSGRPGYGWYFGRDGVWSAFALLDYGDFEKAKQILKTYQDFQSLDGKIYHELSTSGIVHYDASDATPLYLILAGRYLRHSGDIEFIVESWPNIQKAIEFCFSTDTDADHLIENTNVGHGWVEGGHLFGSHTSLYLASCWAEALDEASFIAGALDRSDQEANYKYESDLVKELINNDYWNPDGNYLNQGKFQDGTYHTAFSIMPSIPLYFGHIDSSLVNYHLDRYAYNNFSSDWGVRIVGEDHPDFNPRGYHSGSVWPLYTGWTALAEYKNGYSLQGYTHVMNNLLNYKDFALGYVEEVLNGEVYLPSGVCPHQCWSETMVSQPVIEGMLGFEPDAIGNSVIISPAIPFDWNNMKVVNMRVGNNRLNLLMEKELNKTTYFITAEFHNDLGVGFIPAFPPGTQFNEVIINGKLADFSTKSETQNELLYLDFRLLSKAVIEVNHSHGISIIPTVPNPKPGDKSNGFRILSATLSDDIYTINIEGRSGARETMQVLINDQNIDKIKNGIVLSKKGNIYTVQLDFDDTDSKYALMEVGIKLK